MRTHAEWQAEVNNIPAWLNQEHPSTSAPVRNAQEAGAYKGLLALILRDYKLLENEVRELRVETTALRDKLFAAEDKAADLARAVNAEGRRGR